MQQSGSSQIHLCKSLEPEIAQLRYAVANLDRVKIRPLFVLWRAVLLRFAVTAAHSQELQYYVLCFNAGPYMACTALAYKAISRIWEPTEIDLLLPMVLF